MSDDTVNCNECGAEVIAGQEVYCSKCDEPICKICMSCDDDGNIFCPTCADENDVEIESEEISL